MSATRRTTCTTHRARRLPGMGILRADHGGRRTSRARLRSAGRHQAAGRRTSSRCCRCGRMVLDRNPDNFFAEIEQSAFGTGVLVDGIDFSDDKMLQGRTLSYSDTQRYRVGAELPAAADQRAAGTGARLHQPARRPDGLLRRRRRREQARQLRAQRWSAACSEAPKPAQGLPPAGRGPSRPLPDHRARPTTTRRPASATAPSRTGSATT